MAVIVALLCISLMSYYVRQAELAERNRTTLQDLEDASSQEAGEVPEPKVKSKVEIDESNDKIIIKIKK